MKADAGEISVRHNVAEQRFEAGPEGQLSVLDYAVGGGVITFTHTYTPPEQRGRGIAEKLVRAGLAHAGARKLRVVPACSYVAAFMDRNAEFKSLLA